MRDRFVRGALNQGQMRKTNGELVHNHLIFDGNHLHGIQAGNTIQFGSDKSGALTSTTLFDITDNATSLPDYYAVAYIMEWEGW